MAEVKNMETLTKKEIKQIEKNMLLYLVGKLEHAKKEMYFKKLLGIISAPSVPVMLFFVCVSESKSMAIASAFTAAFCAFIAGVSYSRYNAAKANIADIKKVLLDNQKQA